MTQDASKAPSVSAPSDAFRFGKNWQRYVTDYLDAEREQAAAISLLELLDSEVAGRSFLDIGAGSGLFSLCAYKLGAAQVVSFDVDPDSVASCQRLKESAGAPDNWVVTQDSILDPTVKERIPQADIVYSWGVLHHTGDLWTAVRHAASLVKPGGLFCIALYQRVDQGVLNSARWLKIKRAYSRASRPVQKAMELVHQAYWVAGRLRARQSPWEAARNYKERGMAVKTDLVDWLGGYPYEPATPEDVTAFCQSQCGMELRTLLRCGPSHSNNQFVFQRVASPATNA